MARAARAAGLPYATLISKSCGWAWPWGRGDADPAHRTGGPRGDPGAVAGPPRSNRRGGRGDGTGRCRPFPHAERAGPTTTRTSWWRTTARWSPTPASGERDDGGDVRPVLDADAGDGWERVRTGDPAFVRGGGPAARGYLLVIETSSQESYGLHAAVLLQGRLHPRRAACRFTTRWATTSSSTEAGPLTSNDAPVSTYTGFPHRDAPRPERMSRLLPQLEEVPLSSSRSRSPRSCNRRPAAPPLVREDERRGRRAPSPAAPERTRRSGSSCRRRGRSEAPGNRGRSGRRRPIAFHRRSSSPSHITGRPAPAAARVRSPRVRLEARWTFSPNRFPRNRSWKLREGDRHGCRRKRGGSASPDPFRRSRGRGSARRDARPLAQGRRHGTRAKTSPPRTLSPPFAEPQPLPRKPRDRAAALPRRRRTRRSLP